MYYVHYLRRIFGKIDTAPADLEICSFTARQYQQEIGEVSLSSAPKFVCGGDRC